MNVYRASNLLPLFTLGSVLTHGVNFLFRMGRDFPPDFTSIGDQLCQGAVSFKGHAKEPKPCAVGSCLNYLFGLCCLVLMTLLVKNTIK